MYAPQKEPRLAINLVIVIVLVGIFGGIYIHELFMIIALIFWMQYTAILSYLQFRRKSKHKWNTFTEVLLHPQIRFFIFEFLAVLGLGFVLKYNLIYIGVAVLIAWLLFSINFYMYYGRFKKGE